MQSPLFPAPFDAPAAASRRPHAARPRPAPLAQGIRAVVLGATLLATAAHAAEDPADPQVTRLPTVQVTEDALAPTSGYTAFSSSGATKTDAPLVTTAQSVSVVTRQQMEDQNVVNVNQALNYTPGVFTNFAGAAGRYDTVALRGFHGGDVDNTFLDGLRLMSDGGSYNALQVDAWFLERIDVIRGPSSALYGQTIPGGLVAMTSKRPLFDAEGHLRLMAGNNGTTGAAFDYTDAINDQWAFRLTGIARNSDTQYDHTREERYALSPSLLWQPDADTSLVLRAYLHKDPSGGYHSAVPGEGSLVPHNGYRLSTGFYDGERSRDQFRRYQQIYSYAFAHRFNDTWAFRSNASYTHSNVAQDQVYQIGWVPGSDVLNRYYSGERSSLDAFALDNQLQADFATGALAHRVVLGAEYHQYRNELWDASGYADRLNAVTGAGGANLWLDAALTQPGVYAYDATRRYRQAGVYLQDEMEWNRWHLDLSARYDHLVLESENATYGTERKRTDDHISGRASLLYAFDSGFSPYVSYSQAITPTALAGADGNLLKPTTAEQVEGGLKYQPAGRADFYSLALYDLTQKDVANRDIITATYVPAGKVRARGVELEAHTQVTDRLSLVAGYTYNHVRFEDSVDGNEGNTPYVTPNTIASLWAHYRLDEGLSGGLGVRRLGKQWADNENTTRLPAVTLYDANVRADLGAWNARLRGLWLQLTANNVTDRTYVAACYGTGYCYWGAERSVVATVGYDF
ncbi:iron complex outermembrane receptor protein [Xanthomonas arboricola]|uniref:TonB-dependent siderophore receptor n=1 Tax=Xanthomonas euroxanthea TaxID=2259622 RepID=UPI00141B5D4C|nr:TonB-dependent siderophore receptor [Xanthomonas euroxanthea]MBB3813147.1 iron complex outermembrane receptor protein [Xanthomonas euroxanthea]NIK08987.1 iron complex outermembrane receptor protein [Xanthomonas euroxanthea]NIK40805.1 iron complex outermembrane receptor protein [Xanthomonas euroxanthea]